MRRREIVKKCSDFLNNASAREAAVLTEADSLISDMVRCYEEWLEKNHRCFTNLLEATREEVALLLTAPKMTLSPLSQILVNRIHSLTAKEENLLCTIPEEKSLKEIVQHCNQALAKSRKALQQEYENEVQQAFMKPTQGVQYVKARPASAQLVQKPGQAVQSPAQGYQAPPFMIPKPGQGVQQFPGQGYQASSQLLQKPGQTVQPSAQGYQAPPQSIPKSGQGVEQLPGQGYQASPQLIQKPGQAVQPSAQGYQAPPQMIRKSLDGVQHISRQAFKAPLKVIQQPIQEVQFPAEGDEQKLIAVLEDQVKCFDVAANQWQELFALRRNIQVDNSTSSTFIPPNRILLCGGGGFNACTCHVGSSAYMLEDDGSVTELPHMSTERRAPGIAWDSVRQALYVFGGGGTCYTAVLRTSEMFLFKWSPLSDMHEARSAFNPCWHSSIVYLCGGFTFSVETYDPRSNTFTLQDFSLPETGETTSVVESGVVTVISKRYISKLDQGRLTSHYHEQYGPWSSCTPVVSGGALYICWAGTCRCINLTTGEVQKHVRLS